MAFGCLYVDFFFVSLGFELVYSVVFFFLEYHLRSGGLNGHTIVATIALVTLSMFCYGVILGTQTDRGADSSRLEHKSQIDMLTGLYNKLSFEEMARDYLNNRPLKEACCLLIIDFDRIDVERSMMEEYIASRPIFAKITVEDFK